MIALFHYTDIDGWNAIRSQKSWRFVAAQPKDEKRPFGAYFTDIAPTKDSLRTLYKRLRVPRIKQEFVFCFHGAEGLKQHRDGRGRDQHIYYSPTTYEVEELRQNYAHPTASVLEESG